MLFIRETSEVNDCIRKMAAIRVLWRSFVAKNAKLNTRL